LAGRQIQEGTDRRGACVLDAGRAAKMNLD